VFGNAEMKSPVSASASTSTGARSGRRAFASRSRARVRPFSLPAMDVTKVFGTTRSRLTRPPTP
jgi:hypothetical protein